MPGSLGRSRPSSRSLGNRVHPAVRWEITSTQPLVGKFGANGDRDGLVAVDAGELVNVLEIRPETTLTPLGSIVNISVRSAAQAIHIVLVEVATVAVEAKVAKAQ